MFFKRFKVFYTKISPSPSGAHLPSLHSRMTVPGASASTVCHWPTPRLNGIQHPLRTVLRRIPEVEVHPQPRRRLRLGSKGIEGGVGDFHHFLLILAKILNPFSVK